jgi:hypothetical protein
MYSAVREYTLFSVKCKAKSVKLKCKVQNFKLYTVTLRFSLCTLN